MWLCVQLTSETKVLDKRNFQVGEVCDVPSGDVMPTGSRVMSYDNSCGVKLFSYCVLFHFLSLSLFLCLVWKHILVEFWSSMSFMPGSPEELEADFVLYTGDFSRHHMEQLGGVVRASRQMCL